MNNISAIEVGLKEFSEFFPEGNRFAVPTQHLYPSHGNVTVYIEPFRVGSFRVTDNGGASDELSALGLLVDKPDRLFRSTCRQYGVKSTHGIIHSETVDPESIAASIVLVAAASAKAVEHSVSKLKPGRHRDLGWPSSTALGSEARPGPPRRSRGTKPE